MVNKRKRIVRKGILDKIFSERDLKRNETKKTEFEKFWIELTDTYGNPKNMTRTDWEELLDLHYNDLKETREALICSKCGFPKDMQREIVLLTKNIFSYFDYEENVCEECGHQKDGSTISSVYKLLNKVVNKKIKKRKNIIKFIKHFTFLTKKEREEVCLKLPRFIKNNYKSKGNLVEDNFEEPYSWNVVYLEILNDTALSRTMLATIDWEKIKGGKS